MTGDVNLERVERVAERLQDRYGEVPVEREVVEQPAAGFEELVANARDGYNGGAYAWVVRDPADAAELTETFAGEFDDRERVLMILPRDGDEWGLPGGGREGEESWADAAVREVREEAGVNCEVTGLWLLRHNVWRSPATEHPDTHSLHAFFDARYAGGSIAVQPGEVNGAAWFAALPERMMPANERRAADWSP
jgi:8-oxo-dGTP diphosphatase